MKISVVVCTHNRADLLDRLVASLVDAEKPGSIAVEVLIVANACSDHTGAVLKRWTEASIEDLKICATSEPNKGKSHALNHALRLVNGDVAVFVDDDQRVSVDFFSKLAGVLEDHQDINIFCGRILPDWDGSEPGWVRDTGPYRIYPPPITTFDAGGRARSLDDKDFKPPGGNLVFRVPLMRRLGDFSTKLGPKGHNFAGGEDAEFLQRALTRGECLHYDPAIVQYHHVDVSRLTLPSLLRLSFQRSRAAEKVSIDSTKGIPLFIVRKLIVYIARAVFSNSFARSRFYLVRCAATLGEGVAAYEHGTEKAANDA